LSKPQFFDKDRFDMDIRFVSSLTPDDENLFAPALLKAVGALLDQLPIAYTMRIETTGAQVYQHTHATANEKHGAEASTSGNGNRALHYIVRATGAMGS
jgi:hypothetical protein